MAGSLLAQLARRGGGRLLDLAVGKALPGDADAAKPSLKRTIAGAALTRIATKSVPGAILVGGGLLAKALYDRKVRNRRGRKKG